MCFISIFRCGKSSIKRVVFQNLEPTLSTLIDPAAGSDGGVSVVALNRFLNLHLANLGPDCLSGNTFGNVKAIIYVIDLVGDYITAVSALIRLMEEAKSFQSFPDLDVFLHKSDGITADEQISIQSHISMQIMEEPNAKLYSIRFFLTSIYDYSIILAISKVVQRYLKIVPELTRHLDRLCEQHRYTHAYIFDVISKVCVASDSFQTNTDVYSIFMDSMDVIEDMSSIYVQNSHDSPIDARSTLISDENHVVHHYYIANGITLMISCSSNSTAVIGTNCLQNLHGLLISAINL